MGHDSLRVTDNTDRIGQQMSQHCDCVRRIFSMEVRAQSDPFAWLEDQHSPETRRFLDHEGHRYDAYLAQHASLRSRVGSRVAELLKVETVELPFPDHGGGLIFLK